MTSPAATVKRLVILAPNWLGDAVMSLPAIHDVCRALSPGAVTVAARAAVSPLFSLVPGLATLTLRPGRARAQTVAEFQAGGFDTALLLPNSFASALAVWRAGIPQRWGYRTDCRGPLLTRSSAAPRKLHQAAYYQHLTAGLGFERGPLEPKLEVPASARAAAADLLRARGWDGRTPLVALAPGAAYGGAKRWPASSFASLASDLGTDGIASVLVGSQADAAAGAELLRAIGPGGRPPINLIGETDLPALAGVLIACRALVSNDSGAMHLGAALGVSVTAMFGPTNEQATYPLGKDHIVLTHDVWCRPCMLRECPFHQGCMRGITVEAVAAAARRRL